MLKIKKSIYKGNDGYLVYGTNPWGHTGISIFVLKRETADQIKRLNMNVDLRTYQEEIDRIIRGEV